ncbi:TonB-dependent receptor [Zhouia spongiae]|uniref:TonB-dependent receptor n=1 Tax=Zhouia spongiae TaxID=2202721 RepID=A0ABY3YJZ4_9FLAO|nr:TonB-dependent receptor [Zhouia spongiae]UNY97821.1 TonB-dependent receptor [Zhouia spongiae]
MRTKLFNKGVLLPKNRFLKGPVYTLALLLCASVYGFNHTVLKENHLKNNTRFQTNISGKITDEEGIAIPGVSVVIKGTNIGVATDFDGIFNLSAPNPNAILIVSSVGFKTQEVPINGRTNIDIILITETSTLDEVVVVGYGTQKKLNVTGAVSSIKADDVVSIPATNVKDLMIGQVPGLITNQNPSLPGQGNVSLSIRGFGEPLVIVDGIESYFDRLDPNDIESITVLKDASAAIYGARAGNGVILVTTKRGKEGKSSFNYHGYYGLQQRLTFPEQVNASDFIQTGRNAVFNTQYDPANPNQDINYGTLFTEENLELYSSGQKPSYSWVDGLLRNSGSPLSSHNFSLRGGSENVKYFTSVGTLSQQGIFNGDYQYNKMTVTNNLDVDITDELGMSLTSQYIDQDRDYASGSLGEIWNELRTSQPIYAYELPDKDRAPYTGFSQRNPVARSQKKFAGYNKTKVETLTAALELKYSPKFLEGLTLGAKTNVRLRTISNETLNQPYDVWSYDPAAVTEDFDGYTKEATILTNSFSKSVNGGDGPRRRILSRLYGQFDNTFNDHQIGLLVFGEKEDNTYNSLGASRRDLLTTQIPQINGPEDLTSTSGTGRDIEYTRVSFAGRLNYNYKEKYLFEATLRADASSKFGTDVRWGYFPSVMAGWNIAKEDFLNSTSVDELKLRLSYSETGIDNNVSNTAFDFLTGYEELNDIYIIDGEYVPVIRTAGIVNPNITWEETTLYNAGLDLSLFKGKLYANLDVFYRKREGLLRRPLVSLPNTFGANLPLVNTDSRSNRGFDAALGYRTQINDFKIDLNAGIGFSREKYEDYLEEIDETDPVQVKFDQRSGRWVNRWFGYKSNGLFNTQQEVDDYLSQYTIEGGTAGLNGTPKVGDIRYSDLNGDNIIDRADRYQMGYGSNPEITYSLNTRFSYKNFSLSMLWQGASRFNVNVNGLLRAPFSNEQVPLTLHTKYSWTQDPSNPGIGNNPNAQLPAYERSGSRQWNNAASDFWLKDGTYFRLKTANLSYNLPKEVIKTIGFTKVLFYVSGDNLITFSNLGIYKNAIDPEESSAPNAFNAPLLRTYSFGVQLGL